MQQPQLSSSDRRQRPQRHQHIDYSVVVDLLIGGMIMRSATHGQVDHQWSDSVVTLLWPVISRGPE